MGDHPSRAPKGSPDNRHLEQSTLKYTLHQGRILGETGLMEVIWIKEFRRGIQMYILWIQEFRRGIQMYVHWIQDLRRGSRCMLSESRI